jgi:hypothetical protein
LLNEKLKIIKKIHIITNPGKKSEKGNIVGLKNASKVIAI